MEIETKQQSNSYEYFQASKFDIYVYYCTNKPKSTDVLVAHGSPYFENLQKAAGIDQPIAAFLIKPVQRYVLISLDNKWCSWESVSLASVPPNWCNLQTVHLPIETKLSFKISSIKKVGKEKEKKRLFLNSSLFRKIFCSTFVALNLKFGILFICEIQDVEKITSLNFFHHILN